MRDAERAARRRREHRPTERAVVAVLASVVTLGTLAMPDVTRGAEPDAAAARQHLAETLGGTPNDFELVYERTSTVAQDTLTLWAGKFLDRRTGEIHAVYRDAAGGALGGAQLEAQSLERAAVGLSALELKGDAELRAAVDAKLRNRQPAGAADPSGASAADAAATSVPVGVWLDVDSEAAEQAVIARHPELKWEGDRPIVADLATARAIRAELAAARAESRAAAMTQLAADVAALGGAIGYLSTSAPLAYVDVPAVVVGELAALPAVSTLGLERSWTTTMSSAGPAVQGNWTSGAGDQGAGVRVAVVEYHNVRNTGDLAGRVVASRSTTGSLAFTGGGLDHPTWVAGAIAGRWGVAPAAQIVSSSTGGGATSLARDRAIIAAADWAASAAGGDADVINASIGQDTATGSEEARRYFDAIAHEDGRLPVAAAGNFTTFGHWDILSPGVAYNVLTVGGVDDRGTAGRTDDRIWYVPGSNGSNYRDRTGTSWNAHGDYNKPNVSAPAVSVTTANGLGASGTSVASPIVAGIAAQLIARLPSLALRPEATRAIMMAGAINRSPMPDGSKNADHEGTGTASALWSNRLLTAGDAANGGHRMGAMTPGQTVVQDIAVVQGQRIKVVVSWNSRTAGTSIANRTDRLTADLDLRVVQPNGAAVGSFTFDNNYEWVEFIAARSGTARIEVRQARFEATSERYGLAWAKVNLGTPSRIAGLDRYSTAAAVSRASFAPGVPVAYVATGQSFPDALAAGPAAGMQGGPVLLTDPRGLSQAIRDELTRLRPGRIVVAGGPRSLPNSIVAALDAYTAGSVTRVAGADRYGTAAAISRSTFAPSVPAAFVATGTNFPDALAAGPAAIRNRGPVILTPGGSLPQVVRDELVRLNPQRVYVVGGAAAVSEAVRQALEAYSVQPVARLAGQDRYGTAAAVSAAFFNRPAVAWLATGTNFPDALAASPAAGRASQPLLLVTPTSLPAPTRAELARLVPARTFLVGGTASIGASVVSQINALLGKP